MHDYLCCHVCKHWLLAHARDTGPYSAMIRYLREREDGDLVLGIVGQVLVEIGQAGRIPAELVIHHPQLVSSRHLPATLRSTPRQAWISLIWALPTLPDREKLESNLCPAKAVGHLGLACCQPAGCLCMLIGVTPDMSTYGHLRVEKLPVVLGQSWRPRRQDQEPTQP